MSSTQLFTELVIEIFRLNGLILDAGDYLTQPVGLTSARWQVLGIVEHGASPVANVARTMGLTRQTVQHTANGLKRNGFIIYRENPHHRRAKLIEITPKGQQALSQIGERQAAWAQRIAGMTESDRLADALALLRELHAALERDNPNL